MKFTLLQLIVCVGIILFIAFVVINSAPKPSTSTLPQQPGVTIPFMNIKMK